MPLFRGRPDLLQRFRLGHREVLEQVYWAYFDKVERIIRLGFYLATVERRVFGVPRAEVADLIQEVFARAFRQSARQSYDGDRLYGTFLSAIARNTVNDWARRRAYPTVDLPEEYPDGGGEPEVAWADAAIMQLVETYLAELSSELRSVHEQRFVLGLSQVEAASVLGVSRQQLRTLESKLQEGLRRVLHGAGLLEDV